MHSVRHYVDGYNLIFALYEEPDEKDLQGQREACYALINTLAQRITPEIAITIVFDARKAPASHRYQQGAVELVYTDQQTNADDWIVEHLNFRQREQSTVVTNDRHLSRRCRALKATVQSPEAWLRWLQKKARKSQMESALEQGGVASLKREEKRVLSSKNAARIQQTTVQPSSSSFSPSFPKDDPRFLERQPGESEMERWLRIFESESESNFKSK